jgi:phosphate transport system permease protein
VLTLQDHQGSAKRRSREALMRGVFFAAAAASVVISALILIVLFRGLLTFMGKIDWDLSMLKDSGWFPRRDRFDLTTILAGSLVMGVISLLVAVPFGLGTAIYLSEYAPPKVRAVLKPVIEVLAGMPSVVVGFFALSFIAPDITQKLFSGSDPKNMLIAGLGIGILVIPIMASVSEDALRAVPGSLREASYGIGAKKVTTVVRVVLPAAVSGLVAAFIIAASRAIGETMVATMAGGLDGSGPFAIKPLDKGLSMTGAMTNAAGGTDNVQGSAPYYALFLVGFILFTITLSLNLIGDRFVQRVRQKY